MKYVCCAVATIAGLVSSIAEARCGYRSITHQGETVRTAYCDGFSNPAESRDAAFEAALQALRDSKDVAEGDVVEGAATLAYRFEGKDCQSVKRMVLGGDGEGRPTIALECR